MEVKICINGLTINYQIFGNRNNLPVLILHGWGRGAISWEQFGNLLAAQDFYVIIPDLPGFGASQTPEKAWVIADYLKFLENFIAELKLNKISLLGHSFGGGLAAVFAAHNPKIISKIILVDAAIIRRKRLNWRQKFAQFLARGKKFSFTCHLLPIFSQWRKNRLSPRRHL